MLPNVVAGAETVAISMSAAVYYLFQDPAVMNKLRTKSQPYPMPAPTPCWLPAELFGAFKPSTDLLGADSTTTPPSSIDQIVRAV